MHIVIVGAGQAGAAVAARLRSAGHDGPITMIGAEPAPPYQRPPLSKAYLMGEMAEERLYLRPAAWYANNCITLRLGSAVEAMDTGARQVIVGGEVVSYDHLVLTTGSTPVRLPERLGGALPGVHEVRTLRDVDGMTPDFRDGARMLVVGGGYIGLEAAAVAARRGARVTLVEMAERILSRVAAPQTAAFFRNLHQTHGVTIREGTGVAHLMGNERVAAAELSDEGCLDIDAAIVGIGIRPATALAEAAGIACADGIVVDHRGRTSAPFVWAAGDCTRFPYRERRIRLESVQNAIDQAEAVADNILGANAPYVPNPWFWSDQYDVKLQIAGLGAGHDRLVVRPGPRDGSVSHWYYAGDTLIAIDAMNDPRAYMTAKRMIEAGRSPNPDIVPHADLKELAR